MTDQTDWRNQSVLTIEEVGRILHTARNATYEAARRGDFPTVKVGRLIRVPVVAFARWFDGAESAR